MRARVRLSASNLGLRSSPLAKSVSTSATSSFTNASCSSPALICARSAPICATSRSEEHTSELQSLMRISYAVFCLKKKRKTNTQNIKPTSTDYKQHHQQIKTKQ